jgi:hypothetical protein
MGEPTEDKILLVFAVMQQSSDLIGLIHQASLIGCFFSTNNNFLFPVGKFEAMNFICNSTF